MSTRVRLVSKAAPLDPRLLDLIDLLADIFVESVQETPAQMWHFDAAQTRTLRSMGATATKAKSDGP